MDMSMSGKFTNLANAKKAGIYYAAAHSALFAAQTMKDLREYIEANNLTPMQAARYAYYLGVAATHPEIVEEYRNF